MELAAGTNPASADTDGDGIPDGAEAATTQAGQPAQGDPGNSDADSDGLSDAEEAEAETNPKSADTDGDGISDLLDADPKDAAVCWYKAAESRYAWIDIGSNGLGSIPLGEGGHVVWSRSGREEVWDPATGQWRFLSNRSLDESVVDPRGVVYGSRHAGMTNLPNEVVTLAASPPYAESIMYFPINTYIVDFATGAPGDLGYFVTSKLPGSTEFVTDLHLRGNTTRVPRSTRSAGSSDGWISMSGKLFPPGVANYAEALLAPLDHCNTVVKLDPALLPQPAAGDKKTLILWQGMNSEGGNGTYVGKVTGGGENMQVTWTELDWLIWEPGGYYYDYRVTRNGEIMRGNEIYRNRRAIPLVDLLPDNHGWTVHGAYNRASNGEGVIAMPATKNNAQKLLLLAPFGISCDFNRDGKIDAADNARVKEGKPWHWWINDDADAGDICGSLTDVPGIHDGHVSMDPHQPHIPATKNCANATVDHRGDIVDFFPLYLDLRTVLKLLPEGRITARLKQADGALNFTYTDLEPGEVGNFLKKEGTEGTVNHDVYGPSLGQPVRNAAVEQITAAGTDLSAAFLKKIRDAVEGSEKGVILLEGRAESSAPLVLEVLRGGEVIGEYKFPLKLSKVQDMYRWVNLWGTVIPNHASDPTNSGEPVGYPDRLTNNETLVFVHGYSVTEQQARGWCAEVYKRLHQSGSRAKFVGVTWRGDESKWGVDGPALDYRVNVLHAFASAPGLKVHVQNLPGEKHLMAHSLGNMLASSAIKDWKLSVANYFAVDAAVAMEAYDGGLESDAAMREAMCDPAWTQFIDPSLADNPRRLWSTEWHRLFTDKRSTLTWRDRFGALGNMWNMYSSGEEVLENDWPGARTLPEDLEGRLSWAAQEKSKGTVAAANCMTASLHHPMLPCSLLQVLCWVSVTHKPRSLFCSSSHFRSSSESLNSEVFARVPSGSIRVSVPFR